MEYMVSGARQGLGFDSEERLRLDAAVRRLTELEAEASVQALLEVFEHVQALERITLDITPQLLGKHTLTYNLHVELELRAVPAQLMLPRYPGDTIKMDLVAEYRRRGGSDDRGFAQFLANFLAYRWPGLDDRAHLFDAIGTLDVQRAQIGCLLKPGTNVDLRGLWEAIVNDAPYRDAIIEVIRPRPVAVREQRMAA